MTRSHIYTKIVGNFLVLMLVHDNGILDRCEYYKVWKLI